VEGIDLVSIGMNNIATLFVFYKWDWRKIHTVNGLHGDRSICGLTRPLRSEEHGTEMPLRKPLNVEFGFVAAGRSMGGRICVRAK
jgi:hypothetical protein